MGARARSHAAARPGWLLSSGRRPCCEAALAPRPAWLPPCPQPSCICRDWKQAFEAVIPPRKRKHGEGEEEGQEQGEGGTEDGAAAEAAEAEAEEQAPKRQAAGDGDAQEQQEQQEAQ